MLTELLLVAGNGRECVVKDDGAARRGALVDGKNMRHVRDLPDGD